MTRGEEIRRRFPRIVMNLVMVFIFLIIDIFVPPTVSSIEFHDLDMNAGHLVWIVVTIVMAFFLIRALSDVLALFDILVDIAIRRLGIKGERSPKRAARDFIYILIVILVVTAVHPILVSVEERGYLPTHAREMTQIAITYVALGLIILLIYDAGRILYRIVEQKAELLADRLVEMAEKDRDGG